MALKLLWENPVDSRENPVSSSGSPWHKVSTVQVCCLLPVFPSDTLLAAGSGSTQCHCTRCQLCTCAASCQSSILLLTGLLQSVTGPLGVETAGASRPSFASSPHLEGWDVLYNIIFCYIAKI